MSRFSCVLLLAFGCTSAQAKIAVDTGSLQLLFSPHGDLVSVTACLPDCTMPEARSQLFSSYRGFISVNRNSDALFELQRRNGEHSIELIFTNLVSLESRRWRIPHHGYLIGLEVNRPQGLAMAADEALLPADSAGFAQWLESPRYVRVSQQDVAQFGLDEAMAPVDAGGKWVGYRNRFWTAMLRAEQDAQARARAEGPLAIAQWDLAGPHTSLARYTVYAGPVEWRTLQFAAPELEGMVYAGLWSPLQWLSRALSYLLSGIHGLVASWGLAIILLSLLVQVLMLPLNRYAERLQADVRDTEIRLAPHLREIRQSSRGAEQAERIMRLYREQRVHPLYSLKSMMGLLFLVPVFIAAFNMLAENPWLAGEAFLWISDLSQPDTVAQLPFSIPFLGSGVNLLPLLMTVLSIIAAWLQNRGVSDALARQRLGRRLWLMSLAFLLLFYTFPAGMVLYWTVNNASAVVTRVWKGWQGASQFA